MSKFLINNSIHSSRSIMTGDLEKQLSFFQGKEFSRSDVKKAIIEENCLSKRTGNNRIVTSEKLISHYILDCDEFFFRNFYFFWNQSDESKNLLAFLFSYARDPILNKITPYMLQLEENQIMKPDYLETYLTRFYSSRFSEKSIQSMNRNLRSSFTQSGHLSGKVIKVRKKPILNTCAIAYALYLGYSEGIRGSLLFESEYMRSIECLEGTGLNFAYDASRRGMLNFKKAGDVVEVTFPQLNNSGKDQ